MELSLFDYALVPCGLLILGIYHLWLLYTIRRNPRKTVIGLNAENRQQWVHSMMADPFKNGTLAVQTIRNNQMATTQLATISITLGSVITALVSTLSSSSSSSSSQLQSLGLFETSYTISHLKFLTVLLCFLFAFFGNLQAMRYYAHVSFLITTVCPEGKTEKIDYVVRNLNMAGMFWSFGMRAFYFSFPFLLWIFGSVPMFLCCCVLTFVLYFLDTTNHFNEYGKQGNGHRDNSDQSATFGSSSTTGQSSSSSPRYPLIRTTC